MIAGMVVFSGGAGRKSRKAFTTDRPLSHSGIFFLTPELFEAYRDVLYPHRARGGPHTAGSSISLCRGNTFSPPFMPSFSRSRRAARIGKNGPFIFTGWPIDLPVEGPEAIGQDADGQCEKMSQINGGASRKTSRNSVGGGVEQ
jgi:hypothetical protein